jgi:uncharacterized UBP type Zn finger protein
VCRYSQKSINSLANGSQQDLLPHQHFQQHQHRQQEQNSQHQYQRISVSNNLNTTTTATSSASFQDDFMNECHECGCTDNLWICLVCGQIGCGRGKQGHALAHYETTSHLYALDIETQRVWDYAGDGYVHRLIQNVVDGKIVELPSHVQEQQGFDHHEEEEQVSEATQVK